MKYFNDCQTIEEVKKKYKLLAMEHHPDRGGDLVTMQEINCEYAFAVAKLLKGEDLTAEEINDKIKFNEQYRQALEQIISLPGITIEVVGFWIWVTGNTYAVKAELKAAGYLFASKKVAWYFRTDEHKTRSSSGKSLEEIRAKYGSEVINGQHKKGNYINR